MSLFNELKRRNVFRIAAAYVVTGWLIVQVVETIFPAFGFGDMAVRLVSQHDYDGAIEQLFTVLDQDPDFKDGAAREMIITISNMLESNDQQLAADYRRRLANLMNG